MKINNEIKEYIKGRYSEFNEKRGCYRFIIDEVFEKYGVKITKDIVYHHTKGLSGKIEEINASIEEKQHYEYFDERYHIKQFSFTREEMDEIFKAYSKFGKNLTGDEMIKEFKFHPEAWDSIKRSMRLFKTSHVISPETAKLLTEEELNRVIEEAIGESHDRIKAKMVHTHKKLEDKELKEYRKAFGNMEYFLDNIRDTISEHRPIQFDFLPKILDNDDRFEIAISDIHFGKSGTSEIIKRFDEIHSYIISRPERYVNIICLGDLGETFVETGMHVGQTIHMERHGFDLMMYIVTIIEKFLLSLYKHGKTVTFKGIGGNHDRLGKSHEEDMARTGALVIYEMIKRGLSNTKIEVSYFTDKINTFDFGNIHYIIAHGDDGFDRRKQEDILWKNGNNQMYNVILHGDKHNAKVSETKGAMWVQVPCLAGKGEYDTRLDLHSEPGVVIIDENKHKTCDVIFKRL